MWGPKMEKPTIDYETCITCRACIGICPVEALKQLRREIMVDYNACIGCKLCGQFCSADAIAFGSYNDVPVFKNEAIQTPPHLNKIFDIVIVGGGIAGLSTAIGALQTRRDVKVLILEKKRVIGEDSNSSAGTWYFTLDQLPLSENEKSAVILQKCTKFGFGNENDQVIIDNGEFFFGSIDLPLLLKILSKKIHAMGGQIEVSSFVESLERFNDGFELGVISKGKGYIVRSRYVVDASGIDSVVSRKLGMQKSWRVDEIGVGAEYEMSWNGDPENAWLIPLTHRNLAYAWVFPLGNNLARIGISAPLKTLKKNEKKIQDELDKFLEYHPIVKENIGDNYSIVAFKSGAYPVLEMAENITCDGALRVGDAASQANPLLGEGIFYCIKNGLKAGEVLARAENGSIKELEPYKRFVLKDKEKFEKDNVGYGIDFDTLIKNLKKNVDRLTKKEKRVLLEYMMPVEQDWKTRFALSNKLLGTKRTIKLLGSEIKKRI